MLRYVLIAALAFVGFGCASSTSIKVSSNPPGADVYVKTVGGAERQQVGKTPLVHESLETLLKAKPNGALYIEIEKGDFLPATVLVTEVGGGSLEISQELKPIPKTAAAEANSSSLNKGLELLFEAQRLARVGRLDDALKMLDDVGKELPQLAPVHEMRGGIFYLQKEFNKALDEYRKVLVLHSENASAQQMIKRLEGQVSGATAATPTSGANQ